VWMLFVKMPYNDVWRIGNSHCLHIFPDFVTFWDSKTIISDFQQNTIFKGWFRV